MSIEPAPVSSSYRRPLRIDLREDDVLFFQHIPKTAGVSLIALLEAQFPPEAIFPLHAPMEKLPLKALKLEQPDHPYRLVRGHFRFGPHDATVFRYLARNPLWITMLREPIARTLSAYHHQHRMNEIPPETSLEDYMRHPRWSQQIVNTQARMVGGRMPRGGAQPDAVTDKVLLHLATENLTYMACFGLVERFRESIQLLCYTFGWRLPADMPHLNAAPAPPPQLTPEQQALVDEATRVDQPFYATAATLFWERYTQMVEELGGSPDAAPDDIDALLDARFRNGTRVAVRAVDLQPRVAFPVTWRKRLVQTARRAAPEGTLRRQLYVWFRDTLRRSAPGLANVIAPESRRQQRRREGR